jgi:hypothetical protein
VALKKSLGTRIQIAAITKNQTPCEMWNSAINNLLVCLLYYFHIAMQWKQICKNLSETSQSWIRMRQAEKLKSYVMKSWIIITRDNASQIFKWVYYNIAWGFSNSRVWFNCARFRDYNQGMVPIIFFSNYLFWKGDNI